MASGVKVKLFFVVFSFCALPSPWEHNLALEAGCVVIGLCLRSLDWFFAGRRFAALGRGQMLYRQLPRRRGGDCQRAVRNGLRAMHRRACFSNTEEPKRHNTRNETLAVESAVLPVSSDSDDDCNSSVNNNNSNGVVGLTCWPVVGRPYLLTPTRP